MAKFLVFFSLFALLGCSNINNGRPGVSSPPDEDPNAISGGPLEGNFDGALWQAVSGRARLQEVNATTSRYLIYIWDQVPTGDICNLNTNVEKGLLFSVPTSSGTYELSQRQPLSFYKGDTSKISLEGLIEIKGVDEDSYLNLALKAVYDENNIVNGTTKIKLCLFR